MSAKFVRSESGTRPMLKVLEMAPSATIAQGDLVELPLGKAAKINAQADEPLYVANETKTSTATGGEEIEVVGIGKGDFIWELPLTPFYNDVTAGSGSSTTAIVIASVTDFSADVWIGGQVYCAGEQRTITDSSSVSQPANLTLTVSEPFSESVEGKEVRATPLGLHVLAAKFITPFDIVSQVIADLTGGHARVVGVDLKRKKVQIIVV